MAITTRLTEGMRTALSSAGLPLVDDCVWEVPRQSAHGAHVTTEFYVNDAGTQFEALARSFEARVRQALGQDAPLPENGYPGDYLVELAEAYRAEGGLPPDAVPAAARLEHFGRYAV